MAKVGKKPPAKFGTILGLAPGNVPIFSSDYDTVDDQLIPNRHAYQNYVDGILMGYKWQCVEFARRWLYINKGYIFEDVPMAYDIFKLRHVRRLSDGAHLPLRSFKNGSKRPPEPGCMLIWNEGGEFETTGHVAIVTEVNPHYVRLVEQNVDHLVWTEGQCYSRQIKANTTKDGEYWIQCSFGDATILGWVIQTDNDAYAEKITTIEPRLLDLKLRTVSPPPDSSPFWLNVANEDEFAYVETVGGHKLASVDEDQYKYFALSKSAYKELRRTCNELHVLFMFATDYVLQHEELFENFNIPSVVWPRIKQSWDNRRNQMITGRFDFTVSSKGIKVYEYNADSASCYMECGKVQGKWAEYVGCDEGFDSGQSLFQALVHAWEQSEADDTLHIMKDQDGEESYHALFMKSALEQAGIPCKVISGVKGLSWAANGNILDPDGVEIKWVWKTWAWETALDQLRQECEEDECKMENYSFDAVRDNPPRLVDVLLKPGIRVFEPLWTLIPSNKAILPIMWELFPSNPHLLATQYKLTQDMAEKGYVIKPIAGRCGHNISIIDKNNTVIEETSGKFGKQDQVYQELCSLPFLDHYFVQISAFTVAGKYAGCCARVEKTPVITKDSDVMPLRILDDSSILEP